MSRDQTESQERIRDREQLIAYFEAGCKTVDQRGVGTEHEKFGVWADSLAPVSYQGERGLEAVLRGLADRYGWGTESDRGHVMALVSPQGGAVTLEPGGQFELSGRITRTLHETAAELDEHFAQLAPVCAELGIRFLGAGCHPLGTVEEIPWVPKSRYDIMGPYLGSRGQLAHHMMKATCTVQGNYDYLSEADAGEMLHVAARVGPVVSAIFANSPILGRKPNGYQTFRCRIWRDVDADRCGTPPFMIAGPPKFADYVDYLLGMPAMFIRRDGRYVDLAGRKFGDFWKDGHQGHHATIDDWVLHLSTAFPDVRLKRFIEVRGADAGSRSQLLAVPALWKAIFYDAETRARVSGLMGEMPVAEHTALYDDVYRRGLRAVWRGRSLVELGEELIDAAMAGLDRLAPAVGHSERVYLEAVRVAVEAGRTPADEMLAVWEAAAGDPRKLVEFLRLV